MKMITDIGILYKDDPSESFVPLKKFPDDHGLEIVKVFGDTAIKGKVHCLLFTSRKKNKFTNNQG